METILIKGNKETPDVKFNFKEGHFSIQGRSLMENPLDFFTPIFSKTEEYFKKPNPLTNFELKFEYMNSTSFKLVVDLLLLSKNLSTEGNQIFVKWIYEADDEDILMLGEEIARMTRLPFEYSPY
ncbi:hypothetical protein BH10BAC1_BH10BAC1_09430 [soil metagenome]